MPHILAAGKELRRRKTPSTDTPRRIGGFSCSACRAGRTRLAAYEGSGGIRKRKRPPGSCDLALSTEKDAVVQHGWNLGAAVLPGRETVKVRALDRVGRVLVQEARQDILRRFLFFVQKIFAEIIRELKFARITRT